MLALQLLFALALSCSAFGVNIGSAGTNLLRTPAGGLIRKMQFNQSLLICNAYPSKSSVVVRKNAATLLADSSHALAFKQCHYVSERVQPGDKLDFAVQGSGVSGAFEVGDLPKTDAVLLLVLERRDGDTPLVTFSSLAFPQRSGGDEAQLAVIDAFRGNPSVPHLKMEDHITGAEKQTVSKRVEQLAFNRVYAIEQGLYDASVADHEREPAAQATLERLTTKNLKLEKGQNYVVLRTGDDSTGESLTVFPELMSKARRVRAFCLTFLVVCLALLQ